jgi:hypothetical protein
MQFLKVGRALATHPGNHSAVRADRGSTPPLRKKYLACGGVKSFRKKIITLNKINRLQVGQGEKKDR